jgi:alpha-2-macroglobulin
MNDAAKGMLAGAYKLAGWDKTSQEILSTAGTRTPDTRSSRWTWWYSYGTDLRDRALVLEQAVLFGRWTEANGIIDEFSRLLNTDDWYSTQTLGTMLLALGKAYRSDAAGGTPVLAGSIRTPDGSVRKFKTEKSSATAEVASGFGKPVEVRLDGSSKVNRAFVELTWSGVPLTPDLKPVSRNLSLTAEFRNEAGDVINAASIRQGTAFWGVFRVGPSGTHRQDIDNVALTQVLPAGWEIRNLRVSEEELPAWLSNLGSNRASYTDIRDDRIMWFFDLRNDVQTFFVKLDAVTVGEYALPPVLAEAMYDAYFQARTGGGRAVVEP